MLTYPILQAADVLLYGPEGLVIGSDQKQHFELMTEICDRINSHANALVIKKPLPIIGNSNYRRIVPLSL